MNELIVECPCGTKNRIPTDKQHLAPKCGRCKKQLDLRDQAIPVELNDGSFQQFISGAQLPVMVDFYSPTCGPCRTIAPLIEKMARQYHGQIIVAKLDTSIHRQSASRLQIRGVPTLIFFRKGTQVDQLVGAAPEQTIIRKIQSLI
ncbi:thioredoxin family protein [Thermodesulfobacteriota bacterium]